jgi:hypothetical protein
MIMLMQVGALEAIRVKVLLLGDQNNPEALKVRYFLAPLANSALQSASYLHPVCQVTGGGNNIDVLPTVLAG